MKYLQLRIENVKQKKTLMKVELVANIFHLSCRALEYSTEFPKHSILSFYPLSFLLTRLTFAGAVPQ